MLKVSFFSDEHAEVRSDLYLPFEDIKNISHEMGIAKQDDGGELKIERLTITMKGTAKVKVPKFKSDGTPVLGKDQKPLMVIQEGPEIYVVKGDEIQNVLKQF